MERWMLCFTWQVCVVSKAAGIPMMSWWRTFTLQPHTSKNKERKWGKKRLLHPMIKIMQRYYMIFV